jgi:hypothetical protein
VISYPVVARAAPGRGQCVGQARGHGHALARGHRVQQLVGFAEPGPADERFGLALQATDPGLGQVGELVHARVDAGPGRAPPRVGPALGVDRRPGHGVAVVALDDLDPARAVLVERVGQLGKRNVGEQHGAGRHAEQVDTGDAVVAGAGRRPGRERPPPTRGLLQRPASAFGPVGVHVDADDAAGHAQPELRGAAVAAVLFGPLGAVGGRRVGRVPAGCPGRRWDFLPGRKRQGAGPAVRAQDGPGVRVGGLGDGLVHGRAHFANRLVRALPAPLVQPFDCAERVSISEQLSVCPNMGGTWPSVGTGVWRAGPGRGPASLVVHIMSCARVDVHHSVSWLVGACWAPIGSRPVVVTSGCFTIRGGLLFCACYTCGWACLLGSGGASWGHRARARWLLVRRSAHAQDQVA